MSGQPAQRTPRDIWRALEDGVAYNVQLGLYDQVRNNENFYLGRQWEGVQSNGLPTPVFNFIRRIVLYLVASSAADNLKITATPMGKSALTNTAEEELCAVVNQEFETLFEENQMDNMLRNFLRNVAVDGDACLYTWFDPEAETGQAARGAIRTELLDNTRVHFGNPSDRAVERQPYILIHRRELVGDVVERAKMYGGQVEEIRGDDDLTPCATDIHQRGLCTTVLQLERDRHSGRIFATEVTEHALVRPRWDTGLTRYPIVWMSWDNAPDSYHGEAAVTGLIPNQIFVNKMFAMTMISLMTTAYPKVVYDRTRIAQWDSRVGAAIGVNGGDMTAVAKTIDPATISPQVSQFIELAISLTRELMGATDVALGNVEPDNTSAILALQKASAVPMELTRYSLYQCIEDLARVWLELMGNHYGRRYVDSDTVFSFHRCQGLPLTLKLDVGSSAYWTEITQLNTLDNLLTSGKIDVVDYLERVPKGYIIGQQALIDSLKAKQQEVPNVIA